MTEQTTLGLRVAVLVLVTALMQLGSIVNQLLGAEELHYAKSWRMYAGIGRDVCEVRWFGSSPAGLVPLDRTDVFGAPPDDRLLHSADEIRAGAGRMCAAMGPGADVRADARCGGPDGTWTPTLEPGVPLCPGASR